MKEFEADIVVKLKPIINDPEGNTIAKALQQLGFDGVESVRSGEYYEVAFAAEDEVKAGEVAEAIGESRPINTHPVMTLREISVKEVVTEEQP